jgi:hypothetical protein
MFYLFHWFRSFLPLHNPIGFGAADFLEFGIALVFLCLILARKRIADLAGRFAPRTAWCMLALFLLPIALRLAMVKVHPIPTPLAIDDFSYVLQGDTLSHFRFSNPAHPMHRFFETIFVFQEPKYASIYPMGQGIALAIGQVIFRNPWAGVALSIGAFCAACYWMLRGWISPGWSLLGGIFAALQFGALSQWMNSFWGGAVSATAGCLAFGALPRLLETGRWRYSVILGVGIGIDALSRPYETVFLVLSVLLFFLHQPRKFLVAAPMIFMAALPALGLTLLQNKSVTGSWTTLPPVLARYEYGVPTTFTWQPNPIPHRELTAQQQLGYETQKAAHDDNIAMGFFGRLANRVKNYRFFLLAPLLLVLPFFVARLREYRYFCVLLSILIFAIGTNLYPYFYSHYVAAIACLFVLMIVTSLERAGPNVASILILVCAAHYALWYGIHFAGNQDFARDLSQFETGDAINTGDPQNRNAIRGQLLAAAGKQLVFVRYRPGHAFEEWVYNAADIDRSQIVWAHDLGAEENEKLRHYYPDRTPWLLRPDVRPPLLTPYIQPPALPATDTVAPTPENKSPKGPRPPLRFEPIP